MGKTAKALTEEEKALSIILKKQQTDQNHPVLNHIEKFLIKIHSTFIEASQDVVIIQ
jgi:hypothetical protein